MERQNSITKVYTELTPNKILSLKPEPEDKIKSIPLKKKPKRKVEWKEDTVDNENLNRLKSKNCCIYHKPRNLNGDNSSSSSTCTSDDDLNGIERSRETKKKHKKICSKYKDKPKHECENHHFKN